MRAKKPRDGADAPATQGTDLSAVLTAILEPCMPVLADLIARQMAQRQPEKAEPLLTKRELAAYLQVSERQVDLLRRDAGLPTRTVGDSPRFDRSEIDEWSRRRAG